jgi:hypothetical protein
MILFSIFFYYLSKFSKTFPFVASGYVIRGEALTILISRNQTSYSNLPPNAMSRAK